MTLYLLDTDHISLHERGHPALLDRLTSLPPQRLAVSVITVEEMLRGRLAIVARRAGGEARVRAYGKMMETVRFFAAVPVLPYDAACERKFTALNAMKLRVGSQDLRIAATALVNGAVLVTRNRRDFQRVPGLVIEDWTAVP